MARQSLLLIDADPLLRWSIATFLHDNYDVQPADTCEEGRVLLQGRPFDAMIIANGQGKGVSDLRRLAAQRNPQVTVIRLVATQEPGTAEPGITYLEKPFALAQLSNALRAKPRPA